MKRKLIFCFYLLTIAHARFVKRIYGGHDVDSQDFTNVVSIYSPTEGELYGMFCTGVIYNPLWVATAASCVTNIDIIYPKETVYVTAGKSDFRGLELFQQTRHVSKAIEHDDYDPNKLGTGTDLGLLKLRKAFIKTNTIRALPFSRKLDYPSGTGEILGWGSTASPQGVLIQHAQHLQQLGVKVVPFAACKFAVNKTLRTHGEEVPDPPLDQYHFCTGSYTNEQVGPADGDTGGPFVQKNETGSYEVVGLISVGLESPNLGVYQHVAPFIDWIDEIIELYTDPTDVRDIEFELFMHDPDYDD